MENKDGSHLGIVGAGYEKAANLLLRLNRHTICSEGIEKRYRSELPILEALYANKAFYWHGTGRYQYDAQDSVKDVLMEIIRANGLVPHPDVYDYTTGKVESTSLALSRMYARIYAEMYFNEGENLEYQYGSRALWAGKFIGGTTIAGIKENMRGSLIRKNHRELFGSIATSNRNWVSKFRSDAHTDPKTVMEIFTNAKSDIAHNYPILIGITEGAFTPAQTAEYIKRHERRATEPIPMQTFSHIEVPLAHITETQRILEENKVNVPVIPMELGEKYSSQFDIHTLSNGGYIRK